MGRLAQGKGHRCLALHRDLLLAAGHVDPLAVVPDLVGVVGVDLFGDQVEVIVLEHGQAPAEIQVVPQERHRHQRVVIAVELKTRCRELCFVPHRRHRETDMRVARQQGLAALGATAADGPGIAAFELRQAILGQRPVAQRGQRAERLPITGGQVKRALGLPIEVEDFQVVAAQLVAYVSQQRLGTKRGGKAVGHVPGDADGVLSGEPPLGNAQHVKLDRAGVAVLKLIDPVQVGLQGFPGR